jgi:16S rRNA G966 N2-methylase RsmD
VRIVGGARRGLRLADVGAGDAAARLRPTSDRVREAVFNLLQNSGRPDPVPGARVLDLFAGTGALGLEALSRGAARVTFVDDGAPARALIRRNVDLMQAAGVADIHRSDATRLGQNRGAAFTLARVGWNRPAGDSVKISQPFGVTPTECSNCADSDLSRVTAVQSSASTLVSGRPRFTIGSMVKNIPSSSTSPGAGAPVVQHVRRRVEHAAQPVAAEIAHHRHALRLDVVWIALPMSPKVLPGRTASIPPSARRASPG